MWAQEFRCTGLTALQHVESSWSSVSCFGRWILNRWTTREIPLSYVLITCSKHGVADLRTAPSDLRSRPFPCQHGLVLYLGTHWPCLRLSPVPSQGAVEGRTWTLTGCLVCVWLSHWFCWGLSLFVCLINLGSEDSTPSLTN